MSTFRITGDLLRGWGVLAWVLLLTLSRLVGATPPNIILIFTDDQGYQDLGCFESKAIKTPHLDRMAAEGVKLTSFYAQPVCGVSRAALMTGSYPIRVAEPGNIKRLHTVPHPNETTMAEILKQAGYATGMIGKWHLALEQKSHQNGFDPATMPNAQGFDFFYGTPKFNGYTVFVDDVKIRSPIFRNQQIVVQAVENWDHITADYTHEAVEWIKANRKTPFFLYIAHNMPHIPLGASEKFKGRSAGGPYGDAIEEIDWSCGEIFETLKALEIDDNTLVVFTSDNGPWIETTQAMVPGGKPFIPRDHSGHADPLRGWKMSAWEGGSRVPFIARWPGRIPAGWSSDQLLTTMDLLPTFARLAGAEVPPNRAIDGRDATDFLMRRSEAGPRDEYLYYAGCLLTGVRSGPWKLVLPREAMPAGLGWWGRMIDAVPAGALFNLDDDPGETTNVADEYPDVVAALMKRIDRARNELGDIDRIGRGARFFDDGPRRLQVPVKASSHNEPATFDGGGDRPPNFVVIFTDDQGYGDLSCFGGTHVHTPRIDRMAAEGLKLTSFYVAAPVCTPSRAALMTGCYPKRVNMSKGSNFPVLLSGDPKGLNPNEITIAEILKSAGYRTGMFGKWHLGDQPPFLPTRQGFDEFFGLPYSHDIHPYNPKKGRERFPPLPLLDGEVVIEMEPDADDLTRRITERAVAFIEKNKENPFFLYVPHPIPHRPLHVSPSYMKGVDVETLDRLKREENSIDYAARDKLFRQAIAEIDGSVGQILDALKAQGIDENTFVIFTSDNGPAIGSAGPFRGRKGSTYEGGMREPAVVRWPGKIAAGQSRDQMVTAMDLLPTFAKLAGAEVPRDRVIDGKDIWPVLVGNAASPHEVFFYHRQDTLEAVRSGPWKLRVQDGKPFALHNLDSDVGETTDLLKSRPEVVETMMRHVERFETELAEHQRPAAYMKNPVPLTK